MKKDGILALSAEELLELASKIFLDGCELLLEMARGSRPSCIGLFGEGDECRECAWRDECAEMTEGIEASVMRKGTHVRIVSKFKEKKFKPKRVP